MIIIRSKDAPLSAESDIPNLLMSLRSKSYVQFSHYAVAAILKVVHNDEIIYVGGVNVEDAQHNRLSMHAEQNALATMLMLLGDQVKFSAAWVMGAPDFLQADSNDPLAKNFAAPCGHCRQLLIGFAAEQHEIHSVSLVQDDKQYPAMPTLLPDAFSEKVLNSKPMQTPAFFSQHGIATRDLLVKDVSIQAAAILPTLKMIKPHIIENKFRTSPVQAVLLQLDNGAFIPGALIQDIAFLTTDAIYTAIGHAITRFGKKQMVVTAVHLLLDETADFEKSPLSGAEIDVLLMASGDQDIPLHCYTPSGRCIETSIGKSLAKKIPAVIGNQSNLDH